MALFFEQRENALHVRNLADLRAGPLLRPASLHLGPQGRDLRRRSETPAEQSETLEFFYENME